MVIITNDPSLDIYRGKTVLVTGDTGFKGSWLSIWLEKLGATVIGYSLPPKNPEDNYIICDLSSKIEHIDGDIRDLDSLLRTIEERRPDIIFHLAAQALVLDSLQDPRQTLETNVMGTVNVLEAVRRAKGIKALVNVTSDKCYENREWPHGYRETDAIGGKDPYSASKGAAEIISSSYAQTFFSTSNAATVATVRAGNVIGGGDWSANRIVPDCIRALRQGKPVKIRNPGSVRPWQHVLDPLYGYLMLGSHLIKGERRFASPWNFGPARGNMVTVRRLVEEIIHCWGEGEYMACENEGGIEAKFLHLEISKAINELGWYPVLDFKEAVEWTIREYKVDGISSSEVYAGRVQHIDDFVKKRRSLEGDHRG